MPILYFFINRIIRNLLICLIFFCILSSAFGQSYQDTCERPAINGKYLKSYLTDGYDLVIAPLKWKSKQWMIFSGVSVCTGLSMAIDKQIQEFVLDNRTATSLHITKYALEPWGSGVYSMSTMGLFYIHGLIFDNNRSKRVALLGTKAYLLSGAYVQIPKYLFNRHRPYHDRPSNPYLFEGPFAHKYYKSFVSGHSISVWSVATIVASEYKDKKIVPWIAYGIALLSSVSRIHDNKHWTSDVIAGSAMGWAIGKLIYRKSKPLPKN